MGLDRRKETNLLRVALFVPTNKHAKCFSNYRNTDITYS